MSELPRVLPEIKRPSTPELLARMSYEAARKAGQALVHLLLYPLPEVPLASHGSHFQHEAEIIQFERPVNPDDQV